METHDLPECDVELSANQHDDIMQPELALVPYDENKIRMLEKRAFHELKTLQTRQEKFMERSKEVSVAEIPIR